jgi:hypothetical protein
MTLYQNKVRYIFHVKKTQHSMTAKSDQDPDPDKVKKPDPGVSMTL